MMKIFLLHVLTLLVQFVWSKVSASISSSCNLPPGRTSSFLLPVNADTDIKRLERGKFSDFVLSFPRCGERREEDGVSDADMEDDHEEYDEEGYDHNEEEDITPPNHRPPLTRRDEPRRPPQSTPSSAAAAAGAVTSMASKALNIVAKTAASSITGTVNVASPKHVSRKEIVGLWRLDQQGT